MIVAGRRECEHAQTQVDDVEDYDYDNQADREAFCPDMEDNNDAYGEEYILYSDSQLCGSGIRCFFDPGSGMSFFRIPDPKHIITVFWVTNTPIVCHLARLFFLYLFKNKIILIL